ncbi:MAG: hypothetical protein HRU78_11990 [Gammaproteobacteria bacterium]|nr:MAG: hypothetical protein HRU78_11990 [Gammaproteobacteria bacterium]
MSEPTFLQYLIRVGGVGAIFVIAILVTTEFLPGWESYVVLAISGLGILSLTIKDIVRKKKRYKKSHRLDLKRKK